jgi:hypothetical protein
MSTQLPIDPGRGTHQLTRRVLLGTLAWSFTPSVACRTAPISPHLFTGAESDLHRIAHRASAGKMKPDNIQRNSTGTRVYLSESYNPDQRKILAISASGPAPHIEPPALVWEMDDDLRFVAWSQDLKTGLEFQTGYHQPPLSLGARVGFAPGAQYYVVSEGNHTTIFASNRPGIPLASVNFDAERIFCKKNLVYLFGLDGDYYAKRQVRKEIIGRRFRIAGSTLIAEMDFHIPRPIAAASPFTVVDLDNWSETLLCLDIRDEFGAKWFLYDMSSRTLTDLGKAHTYGLFLQNELIRALESA